MKPVSIVVATSAALGLALLSSFNCVAYAGDDATATVGIGQIYNVGGPGYGYGITGSMSLDSNRPSGDTGLTTYADPGDPSSTTEGKFHFTIKNTNSTSVFIPYGFTPTAMANAYGSVRAGANGATSSATMGPAHGSAPTASSNSYDDTEPVTFGVITGVTLLPGESMTMDGDYSVTTKGGSF